MVHLKITQEQRERALVNAAKIPSNIKNSIRNGDGRAIGSLGEVVLADYLGVPLHNTYNEDIVYKGKRYEVKTKERTVPPRMDFNGTVSNANTRQKCDYYAFLSITKRKNQSFDQVEDAYILGAISRSKFYESATFYKEGEVDPQSPPGYEWKFRADCYNLAYSNLVPPPKPELV